MDQLVHRKHLENQAYEAGAGIEPANSGFADRDLTTWLPRQRASGQYQCSGACIKRRWPVDRPWRKRLHK